MQITSDSAVIYGSGTAATGGVYTAMTSPSLLMQIIGLIVSIGGLIAAVSGLVIPLVKIRADNQLLKERADLAFARAVEAEHKTAQLYGYVQALQKWSLSLCEAFPTLAASCPAPPAMPAPKEVA